MKPDHSCTGTRPTADRGRAMKPDLLLDLAALPPLELDGVLIDFPRLQVQRGDTMLHLGTIEWELLVLLARHPSQVLTYYQLICSVWGEACWDEYQIRTVRTYIGMLRRKIEPEPARPRYLCNSFGIGYRLEVPAS